MGGFGENMNVIKAVYIGRERPKQRRPNTYGLCDDPKSFLQSTINIKWIYKGERKGYLFSTSMHTRILQEHSCVTFTDSHVTGVVTSSPDIT